MSSRFNLVFTICFILSACVVFSVWCTDLGIFRSVLYSNWIKCNHSKELDLSVDEVQVFIYDFQNNYNISTYINNDLQPTTQAYNLDVSRKIILFVPGYKSHISRSAAEIIRNAFKDTPNIYLIILDHSAYTSAAGGMFKSYERSVFYSYYIAKALGNLLAKLKALGFQSKNIHGIGHSLGSQILGYASTEYFNKTGEKLWRLTGLDPAGPCFSNSFIEEQIHAGLAEYVEVYHCNAGGLGSTSVLADTDFFFNDGKVQRQCDTGYIPGLSESDAAKCSHKSCIKYWAETVRNPGYYLAWACDSYKHFSTGRCAANEVTIAGYSNPGNATGVFYVSTDLYGIN